MPDSTWFEYWLNEYEKIQTKTIEAYGITLRELFTRLRHDFEDNNSLLNEKLFRKGLDHRNSLLQFRLWEYGLFEVINITYSLMIGLYFQIIRELRFILESWVLAYHIDNLYPSATLDEKISKKEVNLFGRKLFSTAFSRDSLIYNHFYELFRELCKMVHPSPKELERFRLKPFIERTIETTPFYDEKKLEMCIKYIERVHKTLLLLIK